MSRPSTDEQVNLLMQGTEYGDEGLKVAMGRELGERLEQAERERRPLRVYCGFDPRTADLHIGHMVPIRKLRQFQELGHEVTFLIGRFTSLVGDPSHEDKVRAQISLEEATANAETYARQAFKILDPDLTLIRYNDEWLSPLTFADLIRLASNFTIQQFLGRESFRQRFDSDDPIYLHEFFYALMQAYDAYHMKSDVQIGGSDQLFNIMTAARKLMEVLGERPNIGVILGILPGTDGEIRMSKSLGNHIPLNTSAEDMYGKVMSVPDKAMASYFRLATRWGPSKISQLESELASGAGHPRDFKMMLAREIVEIYYGPEAAASAENEFRQVFQEGAEPEEIPGYALSGATRLVDVLFASGLAGSRGEARRLVQQGGVRLNDEVLNDPNYELQLAAGGVLRVGKRRFLRLLASE
ncbi:MAG TPA: tyrosine--tRNA ligase [Anaerolineales bacterium]